MIDGFLFRCDKCGFVDKGRGVWHEKCRKCGKGIMQSC